MAAITTTAGTKPTSGNSSAKSVFNTLDGKRSAVLQRARQCAALTIPSLMPPQGADQNTLLPTPFQSLGARGINNLASKLLLALLPNSPFFRLALDGKTAEEISAMTQDQTTKTKLDKGLSSMEKAVVQTIESQGMRTPSFMSLKLLACTGNSLEYMPPEGGLRVYRLDMYVVRRDNMGHVLEIVVKENVAIAALPEAVREPVRKVAGGEAKDDSCELYTHIKLSSAGTLWEVYQEVSEVRVPGSDGTYPLDECPWNALAWSLIAGEDYGRGLVEEHLGDLKSLESLTKSLVEAAQASSRLLFIVSPNGVTDPRKVAAAENGAFVPGNANDIHCLQAEKYADLRVAQETANSIEQRLAFAFLLNTSIQRAGERVTAEEIRFMAQDIEDALGGVYSILAATKQLPMVRCILAQLTKAGKLPPLPKGSVKPMIITGFEALGRGQDVAKLNAFMQNLAGFGDSAMRYVNVPDLIMRLATGYGIDTDGLTRTHEEIQAEELAAQKAQMMQAAIPGAATQGMKGMMDKMNAPAEAQQPQPQTEGESE